MRDKVTFTITEVPKFKEQLLAWARQFDRLIWLDSNDHKRKYSSFDALLAVEAKTEITMAKPNAFDRLKEFRKQTSDWIFGYFSYDLKNEIEQLDSNNPDGLGFPDLHFFQPLKIIRIVDNSVDFLYLNEVEQEARTDFVAILGLLPPEAKTASESHPVRIRMQIFKDSYFERVRQLLSHIHRGDVYEANFCQEFFMENTEIDAEKTFKELNAISRPPFAVYLRRDDQYLMSASPERYLRKEGLKLISQPIKGTARRSGDEEEDFRLKKALEQDPKERAENIMIVDLVRNDLSKSAVKGSVQVEELCKVYTFDQVHQMISTVVCQLEERTDPVELVKETFPMGSMTGAPKISAMKIIEELEASKRGLYSGAVGYFTPEGDFDFNVVIRSILYNESRKYVSYSVGSAITAKASPEKEYEECLIKAKAMKEVLEKG
ncbi:anthranilate synthase component I family protein [Poritiphilus flavus]|uniref:Aminodeoxychorismate synthase component I n=1 Tax=Poritiphilus flavus TaxID=2697053 RepID=A0A6L9EFJ2_9FLAO|nr:chorismate-binding protein [Poritiphilus flavus]NAS13059.1 aminodeoxychorismate synthase component I [Poritiphilus flavus]